MKKKIVWLPYDFDTSIGINNEGALVFSYNLEDTDHMQSGANIFNGQESVMWTNLRDAFGPELKAMYQQLRSQGKLSYDVVEKAFEDHQRIWPEAIFNEDAWFKYLRPLVEDGDASYLSMLQGSKAEQRKWWLYNRFRYLDSKYNAGDALTQVITLRGYAKSNVVVTPYADVYATVKYGSYLVQARADRNNSYTMTCPLDEVNDTEIYIYSADQLASVGDLSGFKVGYANFSMATKLQELKLGDSDQEYDNGNLTELYLGNNKLLRSLDVRNCSSLTMPVDISGCSNIEHVYFGGTAITGLTLPNGGILKTLQLPDTLTNLTVLNQPSITTFSIPTGENITTLRLENVGSALDSKQLVGNLAANSRLRLIGFSWSFSDYSAASSMYDKLDTMRGLNEYGGNLDTAQVMGTIHIPALTGTQMASLLERYPDISVTYDHITSYLYYYNYNGTTLLNTETILDGGNGTYSGTPTRTQDAQYTYTFVGWSRTMDSTTADPTATQGIEVDRNVYAAYSRTVRTYTVSFQNSNGTVIPVNGQNTQTVAYGGNAVTPANPTHPTDPTNYGFIGWSPSPTNITGNTTCVAQYADLNADLVKYLRGNLTTYRSTTATTIGQFAFYGRTTLTSVETSATTIGHYAFNACSNLTTVNLTSSSPVTISSNAFGGCNKITEFFVRSSTVSILSAESALPSVAFSAGTGVIYVPDGLVSTYKSAANWSTYVSRIYGLSDYPVTDFSTISDSWAEICEAVSDGTYASKYSVGDTKLMTVNGTEVYMQLAAINGDELSNNGGTAGTTWICKDLYTTHAMNSTNTTSGGWPSTAMRSWLISDVLTALPEIVQQNIKEVKKTYYDYGTTSTLTSDDKIWIPSYREVMLGANKESSGVNYSGLFGSTYSTGSNASRVKYISSGSASNWWLRSAYSSGYFNCVSSGGSNGYYNASNQYGVVFGFCI